MSNLYRVKSWSENFEGAKSKTYNNKTSCQMPTKHGLGYRRLVKREDGAAIFGAWCALIQVLSRHNKERQGYCTDTGRNHGKPYTPEDLELLTDIPAIYFDKMFELCTSQDVGWIEVVTSTDTTRIPQETIVPLNSDLDLDLNSDLDSDVDSNSNDYFACISELKKNKTIENAIKTVYASHDAFKEVDRRHLENAFKSQNDRDKWIEAIEGMTAKFAGAEMKFPYRALVNWLAGKVETKTTTLDD